MKIGRGWEDLKIECCDFRAVREQWDRTCGGLSSQRGDGR